MKRVKLGIAILLLLVLLSIGTMLTVQHQTKALLEQLDNLESIVDTGDFVFCTVQKTYRQKLQNMLY